MTTQSHRPPPAEPALFPVPDDGGAAALAAQIADLRERLEAVEDTLNAEPDVAGYTPVPAPRWHELAGGSHDEAYAEHGERLVTWVETVYKPDYGHLAARLAPCWPEHRLCLAVLDWLSELWNVLYIRKNRAESTLARQAEWHVRFLPAAADLMTAECQGCEHARDAWAGGAVR